MSGRAGAVRDGKKLSREAGLDLTKMEETVVRNAVVGAGRIRISH